MHLASCPVRSLLGAAFGALLTLSSMSAQASFSSDITVQLIAPSGNTVDPTPVSKSQTVAVADLATGVVAGNLGGVGDVSSQMLDNERVFFVGNSIMVRAGVGDDTGGVYTTGWLGPLGDPAHYVFDNLQIAGQTITGFHVYAYDGFATSGTSADTGLLTPIDPADLVTQVDADTFTFDLSDIVFAHRVAGSSLNFAEFRIDLVTQDANGGGGDTGGGNNLPEPATLALFAIAALGARAARRHA
jgi:hypothetical protein